MGHRVGTLGRRSKKAAAVGLAVALGVLAPGISPLAAGKTAVAEPREAWMPPPSSSGPPSDSGRPDDDYQQRTQCVKSGQAQGKEIILKNRPWGQMHLQLDYVRKYVQSKRGSVGGGIKVAVIDTGVTDHPFLAGRLEGGGDYVSDDNGLEDCDGHGTQVAGIIAAKPADASVGFSGVAPDARIISIRQSSQNYVKKSDQQKQSERELAKAKEDAKRAQEEAEKAKETPENEPGGGGTAPGQDGGPRVIQDEGEAAGNLSTLAQAVVRAANKGAEVINMSVDSCRPNDGSITTKERELQAAVHYAFTKKDVVIVAAAGNTSDVCPQNDQPDPDKPKTIVTPPWFSEELLAVAAIDRTGGVAPFSVHGPWVSVAAPGTEIISLDPAKGSSQLANLTFQGPQEVPLQGTSFAAPYVSGLAVLVRQMHPELGARQVMDRIKSTAQHPGTRSGHDPFVGYGVINPMAALTADVPSERNVEPEGDIALPSDMPPPNPPDKTPMIVALVGSAGAAAALGLTLFVVHTMRRRRPGYVAKPRGWA